MNTLNPSYPANVYAPKVNAVNLTLNLKTQAVSAIWQKAEFSRFAITPLLMVIVVCMGGFAAAVSVETSIVKLAIVAISCGLTEAFMLALMPMRTVIISSVICVLLSLLLILF